MAPWQDLLVIVGLILLSGLFAGAEIALLSVRKTRLSELEDMGHRGARAALKLRRDPERLLATIQVAITVLGAASAVFGGERLREPLHAALTNIGFGDYAEPITFIIVVGGISYLSLVLGELVPKSLALRKSEWFAMFVSRFLIVLSRIAKPAVWFLTVSSNLVLKVFRDSTTFAESRLSPDELQQLVEEASTSGTLPPAAGEIASRAIALAELRVKDVMIPRHAVCGLSVDLTGPEVRARIRDVPHARYPVFEGSIDNVLGYVTTRDIYEALVDGGPFSLRALIRPAMFLPDSVNAVQALRRFQEERQRFALVVDETGGVAGAVSITDVAEELTGEFFDESEVPIAYVQRESEDVFLVRGESPIHEVERALGEELANDSTRASTIAGLIIELLGRIPRVGETVSLTRCIVADVTDASDRRVRMLRLRYVPLPSDDEGEGAETAERAG